MTTSLEATALRVRTWYLVNTLAAMATVFICFAFSMNLYFMWSGLPNAIEIRVLVTVLVALCTLASLWLWIRMLVDFFRERPDKYPVAWGFALVFGSLMTAPLYFWFVWRPREKGRLGAP